MTKNGVQETNEQQDDEELNPEEVVASLSWQETLPALFSLLLSEQYAKALIYTSHLVTKCTDSGNMPNNVRGTIQHIHCRTLLQLSNYTQVIEYCTGLQHQQKQNQRALLALEEAYALYKLERYVKCRDFLLKHEQKCIKARKEQQQQAADTTGDASSSARLEWNVAYLHILAQCYYRLHETSNSSQIYSQILNSNRSATSTDDNADEVLTNALAIHVANFSSSASTTTTSNPKIFQALEKSIQNILTPTQNNNDSSVAYELAYNYATYLLLSSTGLNQTKQAMDMLKIAEQDCRTLHSSSTNLNDNDDNNNDGEDDEGQEENVTEEELKKQKEIQSILLQKSLMPIQANYALGQLQSGDWNGATRSYLSLILTSKQASADSGITSTTGGGPIMTAENNMAVLNSKRRKSSSVFDLWKRLPDLSVDTANDVSKTNPNQIRILLYNRALLFYNMAKYSECTLVLTDLKKSLEANATSSINGDRNLQKKRKNDKKKKQKNATGSDAATYSGVTLPAPPASDTDRIVWQCRIAILESEVSEKLNTNDKSDTDGIIDKAKEVVTEALKEKTNGDKDQAALEMMLAELTLYQLEKSVKHKDSGRGAIQLTEKDQKEIISTLEKLPTSIQSRNATIATLSAIYGNLGMDEKVADILDSTSGSGTAQKSLADFKLRLELFDEAASLYEATIKAAEDGEITLSEVEILECKAGLVKAVSYYDIDKAVDLAAEVGLDEQINDDDDDDTSELDGEELEAMDIPRLSLGNNASGSNRMRKILSAHRAIDDTQKKKKKKNQEAVLRRRAKRRELYLQTLQKEGRYNPDRPVKPDPERWISKNQRSYAKRGRRARYKFVGAQGGGTGAGADKDAAKLDVAARAAARAEGKETLSQQPSTAHLSVSSTGIGKGGRRR